MGEQSKDEREQAKNWADLTAAFGGVEDHVREFLDPPRLTPTGIGSLDGLLGGGMAPGCYVLAGTPGAGKSATAVQIAVNVARAGGRVLFVTAEMGKGECVARAASCVTKDTDGERFMWRDWAGMATCAEGRERGVRAIRRMHEECPGLVFADAGEDVGDVDELADVIMQAGAAGAALVAVDYLQRIEPPASAGTEERAQLTAVMGALADAAKYAALPVLTLTSMSRSAQTQDAPTLQGGYGTSRIEYDAVGAWQLIRGTEVATGGERDLELHVTKNRRGPVTDEPLRLWADLAHNSIREYKDVWGD